MPAKHQLRFDLKNYKFNLRSCYISHNGIVEIFTLTRFGLKYGVSLDTTQEVWKRYGRLDPLHYEEIVNRNDGWEL